MEKIHFCAEDEDQKPGPRSGERALEQLTCAEEPDDGLFARIKWRFDERRDYRVWRKEIREPDQHANVARPTDRFAFERPAARARGVGRVAKSLSHRFTSF